MAKEDRAGFSSKTNTTKLIMKTSIYKYVRECRRVSSNAKVWSAKPPKLGEVRFATEKEAAIYVDRWLIKNGLEPVILKRV